MRKSVQIPSVRILGLDPGSRHTGYGFLEKQGSRLSTLAYGRISCPARLSLPERINLLTSQLEELLLKWTPQTVALETPFHGLNVRSLIVLAQARGALLAVLGRYGLDIREYSPAEVKSAVTGHGRSDKQQVARMVSMILALRGKRVSPDATDALAVAICCAQLRTFEKLSQG
jgi:crossover junction endodeoxyribonuclease RuvC